MRSLKSRDQDVALGVRRSRGSTLFLSSSRLFQPISGASPPSSGMKFNVPWAAHIAGALATTSSGVQTANMPERRSAASLSRDLKGELEFLSSAAHFA